MFASRLHICHRILSQPPNASQSLHTHPIDNAKICIRHLRVRKKLSYDYFDVSLQGILIPNSMSLKFNVFGRVMRKIRMLFWEIFFCVLLNFVFYFIALGCDFVCVCYPWEHSTLKWLMIIFPWIIFAIIFQ